MAQQLELSAILAYRNVIEANRTLFLLNHAWALEAFAIIDTGFTRLVELICTYRRPEEKSRGSFVPFLLLMQRQARSSFDRLSSFQSYDAWVLLRPCLESALIIGKCTDDVAFATIWKHRAMDRDAFQREYSGKKLRSKSLVRSDQLQRVLSRINDDFMHANPAYYTHHATRERANKNIDIIYINYFDTEVDNEVHTLALLHLLMVMEESILTLFASIFDNLPLHTMGLASFEDAHEQRTRDLLQRSPQHEAVLQELGLWPKLTVA